MAHHMSQSEPPLPLHNRPMGWFLPSSYLGVRLASSSGTLLLAIVLSWQKVAARGERPLSKSLRGALMYTDNSWPLRLGPKRQLSPNMVGRHDFLPLTGKVNTRRGLASGVGCNKIGLPSSSCCNLHADVTIILSNVIVAVFSSRTLL